MKRTLLVVSLIMFLSISCSAGLVIQMAADESTLEIGQTTVVHVSAWADDPVAAGTNGLVLWQMDFAVDNAGVVGTSNFNIVAPVDIWDSSTSTNELTGEVSGYVLKDDDTSSTVGVGGFTEIFTFEVTGLAAGTVEYSIGSELLGDLVDFTPFDFASGTASFDTAGSSNIITVHTPEPASLTLFALMSGFVLRRRR
ncbi:MAG: PEP-CTERM sorting domain-containing protein [Sedimentisphaerales bacterium]|nr:PEP-CTERM sorting domain-containing protein [Sedimentisphaerales bacterium]